MIANAYEWVAYAIRMRSHAPASLRKRWQNHLIKLAIKKDPTKIMLPDNALADSIAPHIIIK
jgi:hypothetical protein